MRPRSTTSNRPGPPCVLELPFMLSCRPSCVLSCLTGALMLALTLSGCAKGTYLVVNFNAGTALPDIYGIRVALTLSPDSGPTRQSTDTLPSLTNTTVLSLPTSAAFKLDDAAGFLDIGAEALNLKRESVARGTLRTTIQHAQTWTVTLTLGGTQALSAQPLELAAEPSPTDEVELERNAQDPTWAPLENP